MAPVKQIQVTIDCAEPQRVAGFWCEVLGYVVPPPPPSFTTWEEFDRSLPPERQDSAFACVDPTGAGPRLFFQRVPEGKVVKNRVHIDVRVGTGLMGDERVAAGVRRRTPGRARGSTGAPAAGRWRGRGVPGDARHRGERVLSRLSGRMWTRTEGSDRVCPCRVATASTGRSAGASPPRRELFWIGSPSVIYPQGGTPHTSPVLLDGSLQLLDAQPPR